MGDRLEKITLSCEQCGAAFSPINRRAQGRQRFCSRECLYASQRTKVKRICEQCGAGFSVKPSRIKRGGGKYCSLACSYKGIRRRVTTKCLVCGKAFEIHLSNHSRGHNKYCSMECSNIAQSKAKSRQTPVACRECGEIFGVTPSSLANGFGIYCSKACMDKHVHDNALVGNECRFCGKAFETLSSETRMFCSRECLIRGHHRNGGRYHNGRRDDLGDMWFRSSWEANYARVLNHLMGSYVVRDWEFEPTTFDLGDVGSYLPDFKVTSIDGSSAYHEVKGYMTDEAQAKLDAMEVQHPETRVVLIDPGVYGVLSETYASLIPEWEGAHGS